MARTDERFRQAFNALLDICAAVRPGATLPAETTLARQLDVSRTVIRAALSRLDEAGILRWSGRDKIVLRDPVGNDRLAVADDAISPEALERQFLDWILRFDVAPGTPLNVTELARRFRVTAHALQAFLASLSRFGLVRRGAKGGWVLLGFTRDFAVELSDFRMMIELHAVQLLVALPAGHPIWGELDALEDEHHALLAEIDRRFHDFSPLDERFHAAIGRVVHNRFVAEFQKVISLVFHYHFQWDKTLERDRNAAAIGEHLRLIAALKSRDAPAARAAVNDHLATSKQTLLSSLRSHALP